MRIISVCEHMLLGKTGRGRSVVIKWDWELRADTMKYDVNNTSPGIRWHQPASRASRAYGITSQPGLLVILRWGVGGSQSSQEGWGSCPYHSCSQPRRAIECVRANRQPTMREGVLAFTQDVCCPARPCRVSRRCRLLSVLGESFAGGGLHPSDFLSYNSATRRHAVEGKRSLSP